MQQIIISLNMVIEKQAKATLILKINNSNKKSKTIGFNYPKSEIIAKMLN